MFNKSKPHILNCLSFEKQVLILYIYIIIIAFLHRFDVCKCYGRFCLWLFVWPIETARLPRTWWQRRQYLSYVRIWNFAEISNNTFHHKYYIAQRIWSYQSDLWWASKPLCPYHVHASLAKWAVSIQRIQGHSRGSQLYRKVWIWVC